MILIIPDNINQIMDNIDLYDGLILSLEGFSVNARYTLTLEEIKDIRSKLDKKDIFVSINKNIENNELNDLEKILLELNNININGVLYSDVALVTYKDKLNYDLVWSQEHLVTNYETINYWNSFGVNYAYVSSDLNIDEIKDIVKNSKCELLVNLFGYQSMFVSKRNIVDNYLKYFKLDNNSDVYYMKKEGKTYPIVDKNYTYAYSNNIYNGIKEYFNIKCDYYVVNGFLIDNEKFNKVLSIIGNLSLKNVEKSDLQIVDMFSNIDTGFLYQNVVSKVKK